MILRRTDSESGADILAWLSDGACRYVALRTTEFDDADALQRFAWDTEVRVGADFKALYFFGDETQLSSNAAVVVTGAEIARATTGARR